MAANSYSVTVANGTTYTVTVSQGVSVAAMKDATAITSPAGTETATLVNASGLLRKITLTNLKTWINAAVSLSWGNITGTLSNQTDLSNALGAKAPLASPTFTGTTTIGGTFTLNATTYNFGTGARNALVSAIAPVSADITDATATPTAAKVALWASDGTISQVARTLYYTNSTDAGTDNVDTLANWFTDVGRTVQAASLPTPIDTVYFNRSITTGVVGTLKCLVCYAQDSTVLGTTLGGIFTLYGNLVHSGTATNGTGNTSRCIINGNATFSGSCKNQGTINGNLLFAGTGFNTGTVYGDARFTGATGSYNTGTIYGNASFEGGEASINPNGNHTGGVVRGNARFSGANNNKGTINGNALFVAGSTGTNTGTIYGTINGLLPTASISDLYSGRGPILTGDGATARAAIGSGAVGDSLFTAGTTLAASAALGVQTKTKASSTSRASTTTYADDPDFTFTVAADTWYEVEGYCYCTAGAGGIKVSMTFPSQEITSGAVGRAAIGGATEAAIQAAASGVVIISRATSGTKFQLYFSFKMLTGATGGACAIQWAQNSSDVANSTVLAKSKVTIKPVP